MDLFMVSIINFQEVWDKIYLLNIRIKGIVGGSC